MNIRIPQNLGQISQADIPQGYKEYKTERIYMARMGDWRENKDIEIPLDGIGGVNIIVKADVHRAGSSYHISCTKCTTQS